MGQDESEPIISMICWVRSQTGSNESYSAGIYLA